MQRLAERQRDFGRALLDPALAVPPGLVGPDGRPSAKRFSVYRNNVIVALIEAIQANFPATCRIVGDEFFRAMARLYVASTPPKSPILLDYGEDFPDFIVAFEPAQSLPYLSDVARIERAWTEAYHAQEAASLDADMLAALPGDRIADAHFKLHPSLRLVSSQFPALTIWRMNVGDGVPAPVNFDAGGEDVLVVRPAADIEVRWLPPGGMALITALAAGHSLAGAAKFALDVSESFDLSANLAMLIEAGVFVDCTLCYHVDQAVMAADVA